MNEVRPTKSGLILLILLATAPAIRPVHAQSNKQPEKTGVSRSDAPAQPAQPEAGAGFRMFMLRNAAAQEIAPLISQFLSNETLQVAVDARTNGLVVSADQPVLQRVDEIVRVLDAAPTSQKPGGVSAKFLTLPSPAKPELLNAASMVCSNRAKVSAADNLLVVVGTEEDHRAVAELIERMGELRGKAGAAARGLRVSFFFLRAEVGAGRASRESGAGTSAAPLPEGLKAVTAALAESGFQKPELLAPLTVHTGAGGQPFELSGSTAEFEKIQIKGRATALSSPDLIELWIDGDLSAQVTSNQQSQIKHVFALETTIQAKLGDYLVLAASPSEPGDAAVALVVRVTPVP